MRHCGVLQNEELFKCCCLVKHTEGQCQQSPQQVVKSANKCGGTRLLRTEMLINSLP